MSTVLARDLETELEFELENEFELETSSAQQEWELDTASAEYNVIGARDDRVRVANTTAVPFRHICKLEMTFTDPRTRALRHFIGTGTLVAQSKVLTAAHCIFDRDHNFGYATSIRVIPGKNGPGRSRREEPLGFALSRRLDVAANWRTAPNGRAAMPFDYGVITLDRPLGRRVGWWRRIGHVHDALFKQNRVNTSGYPGSAPAGHPGNGNYQYRVYDRVVRAMPQRLEYVHDVMGGQSGSPIWVRWQQARKIIGIVTTHDDPLTSVVANTGVRITPSVLNDIRGWLTR
jgi:glutamyl endopeptidase